MRSYDDSASVLADDPRYWRAEIVAQEVSEVEFIEIYSRFERACEEEGGADLGAHVNVGERKAYCFTKWPDAEGSGVRTSGSGCRLIRSQR